MGRARLPGGRSQILLDALLVAWTLWWLGVGLVLAHEVRGLSRVSDTAERSGRAAMAVADTVRALPVIGDQVDEPAAQVHDAGADAVASARAARATARRSGWLIGVSIAAIPSLPVLLLYLPARVGAARERRALRRAVRRGGSLALDAVLARRAVAHLPYPTLRTVSRDPEEDLRAGRHRPLADAELAWFGVERPVGSAVAPR
jgi:hypothetical protein